MEQRQLGGSELKVSVIGFGTMTFGGQDAKFGKIGRTDKAAAARQVHLALDHGVTLFDTSDNYSAGTSEELLGAALANRRKDVVLATKVFGRTGPGSHDIGLSRHHIVDACEQSLRRLGTDWIDLYQVHNFDSLVPLEETLRALDDLVTTGKVRVIGCSNHFAWQVVKACCLSAREGLAKYQSQQILYSLLYRHAEHDLLPAALDQGLGSLIYSPLAQGYLTGKFAGSGAQGRLKSTGQLDAVDTARAQNIVGTLIDISQRRDSTCTPAQVALRWLMNKSGISSVIVGARSQQQLSDNIAAAHLVLNADEIRQLDEESTLAPWYPWTAQRVFHPQRNPQFARLKDAQTD